MKISDFIKKVFPDRSRILSQTNIVGGFGGAEFMPKPFGDLIWLNICDLICDLAESFQLNIEKSNLEGEAGAEKNYLGKVFIAFFYNWGRVVWQKLFDNGFVVIGYDGNHMWIMGQNEYRTESGNYYTKVIPINSEVQCYCMRTPTYVLRQTSDKAVCRAWLDYLDSVMTASDESCKRLGACIIASPKNPSNAPTTTILTEQQKTDLEKQLQEEHGLMRKQRSVIVLPREMSWQVISLANLDLKLTEKVRQAILAICDRIKVPANQVAIIDANSSKSLSNGSELREGDKAKYKSARRLFEATFMQMANEMNLRLTYTIDGEPIENSLTSTSTTQNLTE